MSHFPPDGANFNGRGLSRFSTLPVVNSWLKCQTAPDWVTDLTFSQCTDQGWRVSFTPAGVSVVNSLPSLPPPQPQRLPPCLCGHRKFTLNVWDGTARVRMEARASSSCCEGIVRSTSCCFLFEWPLALPVLSLQDEIQTDLWVFYVYDKTDL